jgi:membrane dipeptidase
MLVDGHLDLAYNVLAHDRDLTQDVFRIREKERRSEQEILVTLPELRAGNVGLVVATLFVAPRLAIRRQGAPALSVRQTAIMYSSAEEAHQLALRQLELYERWEDEGAVHIIRTRADLAAHRTAWAAGDAGVGLVVSIEGADPIRTPDEVAFWYHRGVRLIGPAWQKTRYSGGTYVPGPLTPEGRELIAAMKAARLPLDVSHMAEESFWDAIELDAYRPFASHSNARAITPTDRHLTDDMIAEVGRRDGIVGLVLGNPFIRDGVVPGMPKETITIEDVRRQAAHVARIIGWGRVAIGSDFDGGFGVQETPYGIDRGRDFALLGDAVPVEAQPGFLGGNWLRFLEEVLPPATERLVEVAAIPRS